MPYKPLHPCGHPGCSKLISPDKYYCEQHEKLHNKIYKENYDRSRESANKRGYNSLWQRVRKQYLRANPLCVICLQEGKVVPATVVDHIKPHKGNSKLFWDMSNWQPLCKHHHDIKTAKERSKKLNNTPI